MKIRKITALFTAAAVSAACLAGLTIGASAADENDLVPISSDYTYWFDDITSVGTAAVAAGMFGDDHFYSPTGNNTPSAGKGSHTIDNVTYYNSLRIKNVQDTLVFKVAEASEITFYTQNHSGRGIVITDSALGAAYADYTAAAAAVENGEALAAEPVSQTEWTVSVDGAKTLYLSSYAGDFYLAGITVTMQEAATPDPDATSTPEPTQTPEPTETPTPGPTAPPLEGEIRVDFTAMAEVPVYSAGIGQGFTDHSDAIMPDAYRRQVAPVTDITVSAEGAKVTESTGAYLNYTSSNQYNYGGLIYRIDTGAPGAYHLEVEVIGSSADTYVAPTGMQASRLTSTNNWDNCGEVPRTVSATWEGSKWSYDFATGESFVAIEVEPSSLPSESAPKTVGIKSIKVTPIEKNPAGDKPTIRILGDSTQKTYSFDETISAWGQTLVNYFDTDKVNVINYSMGGRAMKSSYNEGRFAEVLIRGNEGDFVFIHSAHNDETVSTDRFERGAAVEANNLEANNENYNRWLDMYVSAIKARGMIPVLVTAMPRINSANGSFTENSLKPNGFNPDSPGNMRAKAQSDDGVGLVELYAGATAYLNSLDPKEVSYIYNTIEAGETPAANSANGAKGDGTHYREAASKQWCRIMLQSIHDQANAETDTYTDKTIMQELASYTKASVQAAAQSGDWTEVFPEMASDVSTIGVEPGAVKQAENNFYYRTSIEKALQLGLLHKDTDNNFKPTQTITVGEFARGIEKAFGLAENALTNYTKTYAELQSEDAELSAAEEAAAAIASVVVNNGNTEVTIENASSGVVIAVKYDNGIASQVKTAPVSGTTVTVEGIEADKVFVWNSLDEQKPMCAAYEIGTAVTPTEPASEQPTEPASEQPTEPASEQPTEPASEQPTEPAPEQPTEPAPEQPTEPAPEQPTEPAPEQPTEPAPEQPTDIPGNTCTVTVEQPTGGTVTVYNESAYHTATVDITAGLTADQTIADNDYFTLIAPSELVSGADSSGVFADNSAITTAYIDFRNANPEKIVIYTAKADGVLSVYARFQGSKEIELVGSTGTQIKYVDSDTSVKGTADWAYGTVHFDVKAGETYQLWARGGTGRLFGVMYASTDYPQSTEALVVNKGDTVRITSIAAENYVNDSILVNGVSVSTGKETVITVDADTTVTATFTAEPALVENTVIASDAALTREVMGAILYDAYQLVDEETKAIMSGYMTNNGGVPSPDDPNYDPNIQYEGTPYIPTTGWGALTDKTGLSDELYAKVKAAYNMGLIRPETGIARGSIALGSELEPTAEVTRAKAAKSLVFCFILTQPKSRPSHTIPEGFGVAEPSAIAAPNTEAPKTVFTK